MGEAMAVSIDEPFHHKMMPSVSHDELARQRATLSMKLHMTYDIYPRDEDVYAAHTLPAFVKEHRRPPRDKTEVRHAMMREPTTQMWSAIARTMQEMLWYDTGAAIERQLGDLMLKARRLGEKPLGTLRLNPDLPVPRYLSAVDIHAMPGSYGGDLAEGDVYAGALYDRGAYYYTKGLTGPLNDGSGRSLVASFRELFPEARPRRILDLGCAIGGSTIPWLDAFPEAEVHGIDVGAAVLRYAHARAEALEKRIHFAQENGEQTRFPDDYFDVVATTGVFHETSTAASRNIMREIHRILAPGGISMNSDIPHQHANDLHDQFMLDWDCHYNAEPFWAHWTAMTSRDLMAAGGFDPQTVWECWRSRDHKGNFHLHDSPKEHPNETNKGGIGKGVFWGARKSERT